MFSSEEKSGDGVSKKLNMQLSDTKTMLPHDIYREQTQSESKTKRQMKQQELVEGARRN